MAYISFQPSDYFDTKTYTQSGSNNNGNTQTLTMDNVGWVWFKNRDYTNAHCLFDIVRGGDKNLATNGTGVEETIGGGLTFGSSDTTIGADTGGYGFNNRVGDEYVAWHWRAGGSASSNSNGSITSSVSANTTSGFSVVTYTGTGATATVGHGLGVKPSLIIIKGRSNSGSWGTYHTSLGATKKIILSSTAGSVSSGYMNNTEPTTSVFTVVNDADVGSSGYTYVAYCFAEKSGFSKFSSYTGNGNANGTFIYTGFKPAFVLFKQSSASGEHWGILDNKRDTFNETDTLLFANLSQAEQSGGDIDFLSNGFKHRGSDGRSNSSGATYIYWAFAEHPLVSSNGVPNTAK